MIADEIEKLKKLLDEGAMTAEEFAKAKAALLSGATAVDATPAAINQFRLSNRDRWVGGVCGGLAVLTGVDSWIWRLLFVLTAIVFGTGFLLYLLLWIFVPRAPD